MCIRISNVKYNIFTFLISKFDIGIGIGIGIRDDLINVFNCSLFWAFVVKSCLELFVVPSDVLDPSVMEATSNEILHIWRPSSWHCVHLIIPTFLAKKKIKNRCYYVPSPSFYSYTWVEVSFFLLFFFYFFFVNNKSRQGPLLLKIMLFYSVLYILMF